MWNFDIGRDEIVEGGAAAYLESVLKHDGRLSGPQNETPLDSIMAHQFQVSAPDRQNQIVGAALQLLVRALHTSIASFPQFGVLSKFVARTGSLEGLALLEQIVDSQLGSMSTGRGIQFEVLGALADAHPPRSSAFWMRVFDHDPQMFAGISFNALLKIDHQMAALILPDVVGPGSKSGVAALLLDLAYDEASTDEQSKLVCHIQSALLRCDTLYTGPIEQWIKKAVDRAGH